MRVRDRAAQLRDPRIGLIAETDTVDEAGGDRVVTQQRRLVCQCVQGGRLDTARGRQRLPHLSMQALHKSGISLAMGVGVAVLGENISRRLIFTTRDELRLNPDLGEGIAQEQRAGGEPHQSDGPRRLHPHLPETGRQVIGQRARIRFSPGDRRLAGRERHDGLAQFLNRAGRGRRDLDTGDQSRDPRIVGGTMDGLDRLP